MTKTAEQLTWSESRYAIKMIGRFKADRRLAEKLGGNIAHFDNLISKWRKYLESLGGTK